MKHAKSLIAAATVAAACITPTLARASVITDVDMTFASGATFEGTVTFTNDFSKATAVTGTLSGGGYGTDSINWVWDTSNYSSGANNYSNFLMDGSPPNAYGHWVQLAINYADPAHLAFTTGLSYGGTDNWVNYSDSFVSGTISAVPEADSWAMLMLGVAGLAAVARKRRARSAFAALA